MGHPLPKKQQIHILEEHNDDFRFQILDWQEWEQGDFSIYNQQSKIPTLCGKYERSFVSE
jgi:hypothetical protein